MSAWLHGQRLFQCVHCYCFALPSPWPEIVPMQHLSHVHCYCFTLLSHVDASSNVLDSCLLYGQRLSQCNIFLMFTATASLFYHMWTLPPMFSILAFSMARDCTNATSFSCSLLLLHSSITCGCSNCLVSCFLPSAVCLVVISHDSCLHRNLKHGFLHPLQYHYGILPPKII